MSSKSDYKVMLSPETLKDIENLDESECGFCRKSMPEVCSPDMKKKVDYHVVVCTDQPANEWHAKMKGGSPAEVMSNAMEAAMKNALLKSKISVIEVMYGSKHATAGDVIVFRNGQSPQIWKQATPENADEIASSITTSNNEMVPAPSVLMICSHTKRDTRCGYCGPVLTDLATKYVSPSDQYVIAKISHVGGHLFAGNVLHYDKQGMDWFGVVTPDNLNKVIDKKWGPELFDMWRGRMGHVNSDIPQLRAKMSRFNCLNPVIIGGCATAAAAAAYLMFTK